MEGVIRGAGRHRNVIPEEGRGMRAGDFVQGRGRCERRGCRGRIFQDLRRHFVDVHQRPHRLQVIPAHGRVIKIANLTTGNGRCERRGCQRAVLNLRRHYIRHHVGRRRVQLVAAIANQDGQAGVNAAMEQVEEEEGNGQAQGQGQEPRDEEQEEGGGNGADGPDGGGNDGNGGNDRNGGNNRNGGNDGNNNADGGNGNDGDRGNGEEGQGNEGDGGDGDGVERDGQEEGENQRDEEEGFRNNQGDWALANGWDDYGHDQEVAVAVAGNGVGHEVPAGRAPIVHQFLQHHHDHRGAGLVAHPRHHPGGIAHHHHPRQPRVRFITGEGVFRPRDITTRAGFCGMPDCGRIYPNLRLHYNRVHLRAARIKRGGGGDPRGRVQRGGGGGGIGEARQERRGRGRN